MPREKHEAQKAAPFLAKSGGHGGPGGCPDLRRFADHSGGTVADSHGLPRIPNLLDVESKSMLRGGWCQLWLSGAAGQGYSPRTLLRILELIFRLGGNYSRTGQSCQKASGA